MTRWCVDASFIIAWLIPSQRTAAVSQRMAEYLEGEDEFVAPPLLEAEVVSTLRHWAYQGRLTREEGREMVQDFLRLGIALEAPPGLPTRAYDLATALNLPRAYDACYLALVDLLSCDFLTLDERLYNTAAKEYPWIRLAGR